MLIPSPPPLSLRACRLSPPSPHFTPPRSRVPHCPPPPPPAARHVDCDVVVSEVRETSRKPDEMYPLLERLSPGTRKLEIFAREHNLRPGWVSLGNQLDGEWREQVVSGGGQHKNMNAVTTRVVSMCVCVSWGGKG